MPNPGPKTVFPATATYVDDANSPNGDGHDVYFDDDAFVVVEVRPRSIQTRVYDAESGKPVTSFPNFVRWDLR